MVRSLLAAGVNPNKNDDHGNPPLYYFVRRGDAESVLKNSSGI